MSYQVTYQSGMSFIDNEAVINEDNDLHHFHKSVYRICTVHLLIAVNVDHQNCHNLIVIHIILG